MQAFLIIDEQPISLKQSLNYLKISGKLEPFLTAILSQHVLQQELRSRTELDADLGVVEQAIANFRIQHQLVEPEAFHQWLVQQGKTEHTFRDEVTQRLKLERLIPEVTEPRLPEVFIERKLHLDRVILSRLVVNDLELAEELKLQVLEDGVRFEQLVKEHSLSSDRIFNGMMGAVSRGDFSDALRAVIDRAKPGEIIGPLEISGQWCLFRIEEQLPASLADEDLKQTLRAEIFEEWLAEKLSARQLQLNLGE